jgi:tetratricopeptide (TPR) repeat protein
VAATLPVLLLERKTWGAYAFANEITPSLSERALLAGKAFWFYLGKLFWPADLVFIYPRWELQATSAWQYLYPFGAITTIIICFKLVRWNRGPLAALLIFAGTLVPVVGFFNVFWFAFSYIGDHLQYLSCIAVIALVAGGAACLVRKIPRRMVWLGTAICIAVVAAMGSLTWRQSHLYRNSETLYRATLARNPTCWIAHYNLGDALSGEPGRRDEAIAECETALHLRPDFAEGHSNLGCVLAADPARIPDAIRHLEMAIHLKPTMAEAHGNLALLLADIPERLPEAMEHFKIALQLQPDSAETHNNYGNVLIDLPNRLAEATEHIETALRLRPDYAEAHWNLSIALARTPGRLQEAIAHLETALRLKPDIEGGQAMLQEMRSKSH